MIILAPRARKATYVSLSEDRLAIG